MFSDSSSLSLDFALLFPKPCSHLKDTDYHVQNRLFRTLSARFSLFKKKKKKVDNLEKHMENISYIILFNPCLLFVFRNLNVSWELTVCDCRGWESTLEQSRAYFFESSVIVRWSGGSFPNYHHISSIQLHGVRKETLKSPNVKK